LVFFVFIVYPITQHGMFIIAIHVIHGSNTMFYDHDVWDRRGRDRMVGEFTTTYVISACHHWSCEFESRSWRDVLVTTFMW